MKSKTTNESKTHERWEESGGKKVKILPSQDCSTYTCTRVLFTMVTIRENDRVNEKKGRKEKCDM